MKPRRSESVVIGGEDGRVAWRTGWDGWESSRVDRVVREFRMRRNGVDRLMRETEMLELH